MSCHFRWLSLTLVVINKLIDVTDLKVREELEDYYIVSKSRIDNLISCFEGGAKRIQELTKIIEEQQADIARLSRSLVKEEAPLEER